MVAAEGSAEALRVMVGHGVVLCSAKFAFALVCRNEVQNSKIVSVQREWLERERGSERRWS